MRIITGSARGRRLLAPPGLDTRPTTGLVKESVFSIIQFEITGAAVLDLFAGSGQMGIEALSRGAGSCVFVENSRVAMQAVAANLGTAGFLGKARLVQKDATAYTLNAKELFDIAFLDPPYGFNAGGVLQAVGGIVRDFGIIICETNKDGLLPEFAGNHRKYREYRYGKTKITVYRNTEDR